MSRETVVITGGAGFLGSHLADYFVKQGLMVYVLDNLITGSIKNIEHLFGKENFVFMHIDATNYIHVPGRVDYVLHFASPASPVDYMRYPIQTLKVGALGTHKALGLAKDKKAVFLLASTSEVYGDPLVNPQPETYWGNVNPIGPRGVYDEAKRFAEALTMAYYKNHGVNIRIVRIFNTYGPRIKPNDGRVVPNFIYQALRGEDLTVYGDGTQTRSFCYVDDLVEGVVKLLQTDYHEPVNIGNPEEYRIIDLAKIVLKLTGSKSKITFHPLPQDDPRVRRPDITRAKKILGWEPRIPLEEGLKRTIRYFKEEYSL